MCILSKINILYLFDWFQTFHSFLELSFLWVFFGLLGLLFLSRFLVHLADLLEYRS